MKLHLITKAVRILLPLVTADLLKGRNNGTMVYDFSGLQPSPDLHWTPCFQKYTCAVLQVPLDYTDPSAGTTTVPFIKLSSGNASAEDILINPGGPGASGVGALLTQSELLFSGIGRQYNLVGFDNRGVNNSNISVTCFPGNPIARDQYVWDLNVSIDNTTADIMEQYRVAGAWGERCKFIDPINNTAKFVGTTAVAHDMLQYAEARARSLGQDASQAKVWYWGFSYGTVLGATFAALFPDRVGRIIIDGVVDSEDYYSGAWHTSLADTDVAAATFFSGCHQAGPELCAFQGNASSAAELKQRYFQLLDALRQNPIPFTDPTYSYMPVFVTAHDLRAHFFSALYTPISSFPVLGRVLSQLEQGNGTLLAVLSGKSSRGAPCGEESDEYSTTKNIEANFHITCVDANGRLDLSTLQRYEDQVAFLFNQSEFGAGSISATIGAPCRSLNAKAPQGLVFSGAPSANHTSNPILFISNMIDPVTPLRSGQKMAALFPGSTLLTRNAVGHTFEAAPSKCINDYMKAYLADASLPPPNTTCAADQMPFSTQSGGTVASRGLVRRFF